MNFKALKSLFIATIAFGSMQFLDGAFACEATGARCSKPANGGRSACCSQFCNLISPTSTIGVSLNLLVLQSADKLIFCFGGSERHVHDDPVKSEIISVRVRS